MAERYDILLLSENGILLSNTSEAATTKQHKFEDLTPGKKYKIQILTVSGGLFSKEAQTEGRTGNSNSLLFCASYILVCHSLGTTDSKGWSSIGRWSLFLDSAGTFTVICHFHTSWPSHTAFSSPHSKILHQNWPCSFLIVAVIYCH